MSNAARWKFIEVSCSFTLLSQLYGTGTAIAPLFLSLDLGFFLLLFSNSKPNEHFKKAGIRVGLLEAPDSAFSRTLSACDLGSAGEFGRRSGSTRPILRGDDC